MHQYSVSTEIATAAKWPHELFLINLIFNHILMFVAFLTASSLQKLTIIVPVVSLFILSYMLWRARKSMQIDPWFVKCNWQLAARRSRLFILVILIMLAVMLTLFLISGGNMRPHHWAFFGVGIMPTMLSVLGLVIMESDALHQARYGRMPKWLSERYPEDSLQPELELGR
ncbi:MAG: hypothetical protein WCX90_05670 [Thiohalomonadaceae bacterium]